MNRILKRIAEIMDNVTAWRELIDTNPEIFKKAIDYRLVIDPDTVQFDEETNSYNFIAFCDFSVSYNNNDIFNKINEFYENKGIEFFNDDDFLDAVLDDFVKYDNENLDKIEKNIFEFDPTDEIDMSNIQMEVTRLARTEINKKISKVYITFDERWTYGKIDGWFREYLYNCTASVAKNY